MRPKRRLGQHFLPHRAILTRIADALAPAPGDVVVEIGPGRGALTAILLERGALVTAIEMDHELTPLLRERFPGLRLIEGDALELDWRAAAGVGPADPLLVGGNIPYNITSPLLDRALQSPRPSRIVFLVQKEVAERIAAPAGERAYGALSVGVQAVATVERLFGVPAGAFRPPPRVDSAVVRITPLAEPLVSDAQARPFRRVVVGLFGFRRKQLARALRSFTGWDSPKVEQTLGRAGLAPTQRPETVTPAGFARLLQALVDGGWQVG